MKLADRLQATGVAALAGVSTGTRKAQALLKEANRPELERLGLDHLKPGGYRWLLRVQTAQAKAQAADRMRARESVNEALRAYVEDMERIQSTPKWEMEKPPEEPLSRTGARGYYKPMSWYRDASPADIAEWEARARQHDAWGLNRPPGEAAGGAE